jgi:hypothetical protein
MKFQFALASLSFSLILASLSVGQIPRGIDQSPPSRALEAKVELLSRQVKFLKRELDLLKSLSTSNDSKPRIPTPINDIYQALKVQNIRTKGNHFSPGDVVTVTYNLVNTAGETLQVPLNHTYSNPYYLVGSQQHWIERLGRDSKIPSMPTRIARVGSRYAAGGRIIRTKPTISAGESLSMQQRIQTQGFPPGKYRYFIEYKQLENEILQTKTFEFELVDRPSHLE